MLLPHTSFLFEEAGFSKVETLSTLDGTEPKMEEDFDLVIVDQNFVVENEGHFNSDQSRLKNTNLFVTMFSSDSLPNYLSSKDYKIAGEIKKPLRQEFTKSIIESYFNSRETGSIKRFKQNEHSKPKDLKSNKTKTVESKNQTVLIVDDDKTNQIILKSFVKNRIQ